MKWRGFACGSMLVCLGAAAVDRAMAAGWLALAGCFAVAIIYPKHP